MLRLSFRTCNTVSVVSASPPACHKERTLKGKHSSLCSMGHSRRMSSSGSSRTASTYPAYERVVGSLISWPQYLNSVLKVEVTSVYAVDGHLENVVMKLVALVVEYVLQSHCRPKQPRLVEDITLVLCLGLGGAQCVKSQKKPVVFSCSAMRSGRKAKSLSVSTRPGTTRTTASRSSQKPRQRKGSCPCNFAFPQKALAIRGSS